jgi:hypothetical protein
MDVCRYLSILGSLLMAMTAVGILITGDARAFPYLVGIYLSVVLAFLAYAIDNYHSRLRALYQVRSMLWQIIPLGLMGWINPLVVGGLLVFWMGATLTVVILRIIVCASSEEAVKCAGKICALPVGQSHP